MDKSVSWAVLTVIALVVYLTLANTIAQFKQIPYNDPAAYITLTACLVAIVENWRNRKEKPLRILCAEDSPFLQQVNAADLNRSFDIETIYIAETVVKAKRLLEDLEPKPHIMLLDMALPNDAGEPINFNAGDEIIRWMKQHADTRIRNMRFVIVSGNKEPDAGDLAVLGCKAWVEKGDLLSGGLRDAVKLTLKESKDNLPLIDKAKSFIGIEK